MKAAWPSTIRTIYGDQDRFETTYFAPFKVHNQHANVDLALGFLEFLGHSQHDKVAGLHDTTHPARQALDQVMLYTQIGSSVECCTCNALYSIWQFSQMLYL